MQSFNFPLKTIMPYMLLTTQMAYEHLCFIDTPGYNPSSAQGTFTQDDMAVAREFVANAEALIWVIDATSGTLTRTDVQFLKQVLTKQQKPVYFVLNKADLKPKEDILNILEEVKRVLKREKISFIGITAYNALSGEELFFLKSKPKLSTFLKSLNQSSNKQKEILEKLYAVEHAYQFALKKEIKQREAFMNALDDIAVNLNMANFHKGQHHVYDQLEEIANRFNTQKEEKLLKKLKKVMSNFTLVINQIFGKPCNIKRPKVDIDQIEIEGFEFKEYEVSNSPINDAKQKSKITDSESVDNTEKASPAVKSNQSVRKQDDESINLLFKLLGWNNK